MQARLAMRTSELTSILWHQGENDAKSLETAAAYKESFLRMLDALFRQLGTGKLPVIIGGLGDFVGSDPKWGMKYSAEINKVLCELAEEQENIMFADAAGLTCRIDNVHFDSASCRELGHRYFAVYKKYVGSRK